MIHNGGVSFNKTGEENVLYLLKSMRYGLFKDQA
jgi:hypothetical protein